MASAGDWDDVRRRLEHELTTLAQDDFLVVGEPVAPPGPPRGLLRRRTPPPPVRYTQVVDDGEHLYAECVGATSFGGDWEIDAATHERLRTLGWSAPGDDDPSGTQPAYPNYWGVRARSEVREVALMCAEALMTLGADPATLEWRRDRR